jgi:Tfp pilus assembly protein PilF
MPPKLQKLFLVLVCMAGAPLSHAQQTRPSPEADLIYRHAGEYLSAGNYKDAIVTYRQAILLNPEKFVLYKDLGKALYLSGNFDEARETLAPLLSRPGADAETYLLLSRSYAATGNLKKATATLHSGVRQFPSSGMLYDELGNIRQSEKRNEDALNAWLDGIAHDAAYPGNYYHAAVAYLNSNDVLWGLLYGEVYLSITRDTTHVGEIKKMLFAGYRQMFDDISANASIRIGKAHTPAAPAGFEDAVNQVYTTLTPVVSDGITTENLVMVRTRFLMEWFATYHKKYPFCLFTWQHDLVKNGKFEIYNEWLFGEAESPVEFKAWNQFHDGDIIRFLQWRAAHPLLPVASDFYNERKAVRKRKK